MRDLLLSPNGRLGRIRFWQGMVILTVASVLVTAGSVMVGQAFGVLSLFLIYPYICVYGKRLHDAGFTAWFVILVWVGSLVLNTIFSMIFSPFFSSAEIIAIQEEILQRGNSGDLSGMMEGMQILSAKMLPVSLLTTVLGNAAMAVIVGFLPSEAGDNKHGQTTV